MQKKRGSIDALHNKIKKSYKSKPVYKKGYVKPNVLKKFRTKDET